MKNNSVSVVIPVYKPEKKVFDRLKQILKTQTVKTEIVETWNMPEAKSMNLGIQKAKGDIIIILAQDCIPEDKYWVEKLIKPLSKENIIASVSSLELPESYWKKYSFFVRMITLNDLKLRHPKMDIRACAFRKSDLLQAGSISEDPRIIGIDADMYDKLTKFGKIAYPKIKVLHLHNYENFRRVIRNFFFYSQANGKVVRRYGFEFVSFWKRIFRAIPILGIVSILYRYPFKTHFIYFPVFFPFALIIHTINIFGFWEGFIFPGKKSKRNTEVLRINHHILPKK